MTREDEEEYFGEGRVKGGDLRNNSPEMSYKMYIPLMENFIMQRNLKK